MYNLEYFINLVGNLETNVKVSCAAPYDAATVSALETLRKQGRLNAILIGDLAKISAAFETVDANINDYEVIDLVDLHEIAEMTIEKVVSKQANFIMKGVIDTSILLKEFLQKKHNLHDKELLSHVLMYFKDGGDKLIFISDAGMNMYPTVDEKKLIIENSVTVAQAMGITKPNVAMLCAKEKVYEKMPATLDADKLRKMNEEGIIKNCVVSGPIQLDNAVSIESATTKGVNDPVAGKADIFIAPNIETGNVFGKSLTYFANYLSGGLVVGGKVPIVLTSRSDGYEDKLIALILAIFVNEKTQ